MEKEKEMSFLGHLEELRWRLVKSVVAILVVAIVLFVFRKEVVDVVFMSMKETNFPTYNFFCWLSHTLGIDDGLCATEIPIDTQSINPTGQFSVSMYFSFIGGFIVMFPFVFFQLWGFIRPALKETEFKVARGSVFWASLLFLLGIAFGYFLVSPLAVQFFGTFNVAEGVTNNFTINSYLSLITTTTLFSGLFFELPMVIMILSKLGIVSAEFLKKYRKHALIIVLIISAIITPPDVISQILVAIPVMLLYEIGIIVARSIESSRK
ncbi:MAG: twin-arginine translocase subunit TatC [Flavobacteriales bacterium]|nr:twin-arginine translocase subunit TatC [Flavobacteriales bacterium]